MGEVAATKTPCTAQQLVNALCAIWPSELGGTGPSLATACVLASQWAIETAEGADCIQWNVGNFKWNESPASPYCQFSTDEYVNGVKTTIHPPTPGCQFMAYASLEDGVRSWLHDLYARWTLAWTAACNGDPQGFAQGLHDQKPYPYYTAPVAEYAAGMLRYFTPFMKSIVLPSATTEPPPDPLADTNPGMPETD
jgi:hypothetical protein